MDLLSGLLNMATEQDEHNWDAAAFERVFGREVRPFMELHTSDSRHVKKKNTHIHYINNRGESVCPGFET